MTMKEALKPTWPKLIITLIIPSLYFEEYGSIYLPFWLAESIKIFELDYIIIKGVIRWLVILLLIFLLSYLLSCLIIGFYNRFKSK